MDTAVIIYTSGTTGNPKGVVLTHLNILSDAKGIASWFELDSSYRALCILPLFHNNGQVVSLLTALYVGGSAVIADGKVSLAPFWGIVNKYKCTWTSVMPSILSILLRHTKPDTADFSTSLQGIICGGQVLTKTVQKQFEETFGVPIFEGFGLTETTSFSCFNNYPKEKRREGVIGKPMIINEMAILDADGKELGAGQSGEICIRGLNVAKEYLGLLEKNARSFSGGWFHSGDYGYKCDDGYFHFEGRRDFLIIKGGENIYPSELENVLFGHPEVVDCAVIGIADPLLGEEICAFVLCKQASTTSQELKAFCKGKIASFKQPKKILLLNHLQDFDEIPKGPTKKILYRKLQSYYVAKIEKKDSTATASSKG